MKKFFSGLALLTAVIALASCEDDFGWGNRKNKLELGENEIAFVIGGEKGTNTRADAKRTIVAPSNVIDLPREDGEPQLCLIETVTDMDEEFYDAIGATRGTPIYTENFDQVYDDQLYVTAFETTETTETEDEKEAEAYTPSQIWGGSDFTAVKFNKVEGYDHTYSYNYSSGEWNLPWPASEELQFFLQAPLQSVEGSTGSLVSNMQYYPDGSISFKYQTPTETKTFTTSEGSQDRTISLADKQMDLLFGSRVITKAQNEASHDNGVGEEVLLYHALSAVKFKVGNSQVLKDMNFQFTAVEMQLVGSGSCTVKPDYTDYNYKYDTDQENFPHSNDSGTEHKSAYCVTWGPLDYNQRVSYYVEFPIENGQNVLAGNGEKYEGEQSSSDVNFPAGFYKQTEGADGTIADHNLNTPTYSKTFMVVPQDINPVNNGAISTTNMATVTVYFTTTVGGVTTSGSKQIVLPTDVWKAGQLRTFTLDAQVVKVGISDHAPANSNEKTLLKTTNNGTAPEYQRIMLDANWVYRDEEYGDCIIDTYPVVVDGYVYVNGFENFPGDGWLLGDDGFFYYKYPIQPGATPNTPLFTKFTRPTPAEGDHIHEGAHIEMSICVQAVKYEATQRSLNAIWDLPKLQTLEDKDALGRRARTTTTTSLGTQLSNVIEVPTKSNGN